jgi:hypothetical protein
MASFYPACVADWTQCVPASGALNSPGWGGAAGNQTSAVGSSVTLIRIVAHSEGLLSNSLYNTENRHSAIRFVTPNARHTGQERELLDRRKQLYADARAANPRRWSGRIRNWSPMGNVCLNPEHNTNGRKTRDAA